MAPVPLSHVLTAVQYETCWNEDGLLGASELYNTQSQNIDVLAFSVIYIAGPGLVGLICSLELHTVF